MDTSPEERVAKLNETVAAVKALLAACDNPGYVWETVRCELLAPMYAVDGYVPTPDDHPVTIGYSKDGISISLHEWALDTANYAATDVLTLRQVRKVARDLLEAADSFEYKGALP